MESRKSACHTRARTRTPAMFTKIPDLSTTTGLLNISIVNPAAMNFTDKSVQKSGSALEQRATVKANHMRVRMARLGLPSFTVALSTNGALREGTDRLDQNNRKPPSTPDQQKGRLWRRMRFNPPKSLLNDQDSTTNHFKLDLFPVHWNPRHVMKRRCNLGGHPRPKSWLGFPIEWGTMRKKQR